MTTLDPTERTAADPDAHAAAELLLIQRAGIPPLSLGIAVAGALFAAYVALCPVFGVPILHDGFGLGHFVWVHCRTILLLSALTGYLVGAIGWETERRRQDLVSLGLLEPAAPLRVRSEVLHQSRWWGATAVAVGLGIALLLIVDNGGYVGDSAWDVPATPWILVVQPALFWLVGRASFFILQGLRDVPPDLHIELLDLDRLRPVGRIALRGTLLWLVGLSIASLLLLNPGLTTLVLPVFTVTALVAVATLTLPVRGVRRAIRRSKREEIDRVDGLLADLRRRALAGDPEAQARLGGLVAWRSHVAQLSEWPFDITTWVRFTLYLLIPLGSWVGGALVERGVDFMLPGR